MPTWHTIRQGQRVGPISDDELKTLAATGQLAPADMVLRDGTTTWIPAAEVEGLFPAPAPPPTAVTATAPAPVPMSKQAADLFEKLPPKWRQRHYLWAAGGAGAALVAAGAVFVLLLILIFAFRGSPTPPATGRPIPEDVKPGVSISLWSAGGQSMTGKRKVLEVRGKWVKLSIDEGGDPWEAWVNFDNVVQYYVTEPKKGAQ